MDNKIKNMIVQISHALKKVNQENVCHFLKKTHLSFDPSIKRSEFFDVDFGTELQFHPSVKSDSYGSGYIYFSKELLTLTDEQINEIVEYDRKKKEEEYKRQEEAEKARKEKLKEEVEQKEYEQYLRLKKKFEKE